MMSDDEEPEPEEEDEEDEEDAATANPSRSMASLLMMLKPSLASGFVLPGSVGNAPASATPKVAAAAAPQMHVKEDFPFIGKTGLDTIAGNVMKKALPAAFAAALA